MGLDPPLVRHPAGWLAGTGRLGARRRPEQAAVRHPGAAVDLDRPRLRLRHAQGVPIKLLRPSKVLPRHLAGNAYLYVRQSTPRQVIENQESTRRQYALQERAKALGWAPEQLVVIDNDLGRSGRSAADREGFQRLITEVSLGRAGIVLGLEVSRLARNSADWHRLLEICALAGTLILDEDGVYDPNDYNDALVLGLKGTLSAAELHLLRSRLRGGLLAKASRGELRLKLPIGLVYDPAGRVVLDPDRQIQDCVRLLFATFSRTGSACETVKHFARNELRFPMRPDRGTHRGQVVWQPLSVQRVTLILHNPRYAGAYVYGRRRERRLPDGRTEREMLPRDQWQTLLLDAHPGYISWEQFERNERRLRASARAYGTDRYHGPPREGPALLQGRAVCGKCGSRMAVSYHDRSGTLVPTYLCHWTRMQYRQPTCQRVPGSPVDEAVGRLLVEAMSPVALELSLAVQAELQARQEQVDRLRRQRVDRAGYEAELAHHRYLQVDPKNRLVATSLEADWNDKLRALDVAQEEYERKSEADRRTFDDDANKRVLSLADDFPAVWNDPATPHRERKRMVALLIEDVTLVRQDDITLHVRFRGGATRTLSVPLPLQPWEKRRTNPKTLARAEQLLLAGHATYDEVAAILNDEGHKTGTDVPFTARAVEWLRMRYGLKTLKHRLLDEGWLTRKQTADRLGITLDAVKRLQTQGRLRSRRCNGRGEWLIAPDDLSRTAEELATTPSRPKHASSAG